jgi:hypothetical protein
MQNISLPGNRYTSQANYLHYVMILNAVVKNGVCPEKDRKALVLRYALSMVWAINQQTGRSWQYKSGLFSQTAPQNPSKKVLLTPKLCANIRTRDEGL